MDIYLAGDGLWGGCIPFYLKKEMEIYLAGAESRFKGITTNGDLKNIEDRFEDKNIPKTLNILMSFYYKDTTLTKNISNFKNFLLDSGAFTYFGCKKNVKVDWKKYIENYAEYINQNKVEKFFELDIDPLIGYDNVIKLRNYLEQLTQKQCIPVWHKKRGKDEFINLCKNYPYIAIGGIVSKEITKDDYKYFSFFINTAHKYGAKIHGLGFTNLEGIKKYHFDSVDSSSWTIGNRAGKLYKFNGRTMENVNKKEGTRFKDHWELARHNFCEWAKFCNYARDNL